MNAIVKTITPGAPASNTIIKPGDILRKVNGNVINDVLDYKFHSYDGRLMLELRGGDGRLKLVRLRKPEGADIGLEFDSFLMDGQRSCANKCIFCFMDQLPKGMRETLYYRDDDVRLSFLQGNYVTLTNLSERDTERIIRMRVSPINVSVHTLDPDLRSYMLGTGRAASGIDALVSLAEAGITLNCQIVCCPGVNDGAELMRTMEGLFALGDGISSVSVVPVGLTRYREGLVELRPFDRQLALETVRRVEGFAGRCLEERGSSLFFCADELYMMAGLELPPHTYYEDYLQLENGVGMMRLFMTEFEDALREGETRVAPAAPAAPAAQGGRVAIVTGMAAGEYLTNLLKTASKKHGKINATVYAVRNEFFGEGVTVAGLVTGGDIIAQLRGRELGAKLLVPRNMLRRGEDVFLDDVTVAGLTEALGVPVQVVDPNGAELLRVLIGAEA